MSYPEKFLELFKEALTRIPEFEKEMEWESKYQPPPLCKSTDSWEVDPEEFDNFVKLIHFLNYAIFGVDCDGDRAVYFRFVNRSEESTLLPSWEVPSVSRLKKSSMKEVYEALVSARRNAREAQRMVEQMEGEFEWHLKRQFIYEERISLAKGCDFCKGKGYIKLPSDDFMKLSYKERDRYHVSLGLPFRCIPCNGCQETDE